MMAFSRVNCGNAECMREISGGTQEAGPLFQLRLPDFCFSPFSVMLQLLS